MEIPDLKQKYILRYHKTIRENAPRIRIIVITIEIFNIYKCSTFSLCSLKLPKFTRIQKRAAKCSDYDENFCDIILTATYTCTQRGKIFMTTKIVVNKTPVG